MVKILLFLSDCRYLFFHVPFALPASLLEGLDGYNKKAPNISGPEYSMMPIVIALLAPFEVCMPPPLNIFN